MDDKKYIVFSLNGQSFAVNIENVGGVTEYKTITKIPNKSDKLEGIINLRGEVIPILNLKNIFQMEARDITPETRIILIYHNQSTYGFIVDEVTRVKDISDGDVEAANSLIAGLENDYFEGIGKVDNSLVAIISLNAIIDSAGKNLA